MGYEDFVPRSREELDAIIVAKPDHWEYRLFAGAVLLEMNALDAKYEDYLIGYAPRRDVAVYEAQFVDFLGMQLEELRVIGESFTRVFGTDADYYGRAFGAPGVAGDAGRIVHLARRYVAVYEELLLWVERLRGTSVPGEYRKLVESLARFAQQPIEAIRDFVTAYAKKVGEIPERLANADNLPIILDVYVKWDIPDAVMAAYSREFDRIKQKR